MTGQYDAIMAEAVVRRMPRKPIETVTKPDTPVEINPDRGDGDASHNNPLDATFLGGIDTIDHTMYQKVRRALIRRYGVEPSNTDVLRIMAHIDTKRYDRRMAGHMRTPADNSELSPINRPERRYVDDLPASRSSGSFGRTSERTAMGGYKGERFGAIVTVAGQTPPMPSPSRIPRKVASKRNFGGTT